MASVAIIYFVAGLMVRMTLARELIRSEVLKVRLPVEILQNAAMWRVHVFVFVLNALSIMSWPIVLLVVLAKRRQENVAAEAFEREWRERGLRFSDINGIGVIACDSCGYREHITAFLHFANHCEAGEQCQMCGRFRKMDASAQKCECGGCFDSEKDLFCPACRSKSVSYEMHMCT